MAKITDNIARNDQLTLLLKWEGRLSNARVRQLFSIGQVRSSEWIREFREAFPKCTTWDTKKRCFYATPQFYIVSQKSNDPRERESNSLSRYLVLTGLPFIYPDIASEHVLWAAYPDISTPNPKIFAEVISAAKDKKALKISYRSMRQPEGSTRVISPHSLVKAGRRWHVRAFCSNAMQFRDFNLSRIVSANLLPKERWGDVLENDHLWNTFVSVRIGAHPGLTTAQASLIRFEYFNNTAGLVETCRGPLVSYFIQDIRAATDIKVQRPPDFQLAVENLEEVSPWLFPN